MYPLSTNHARSKVWTVVDCLPPVATSRRGSGATGNRNQSIHELYFSHAIIQDKIHPILAHNDRMGRRVTHAGFAWGRGLLANS